MNFKFHVEYNSPDTELIYLSIRGYDFCFGDVI